MNKPEEGRFNLSLSEGEASTVMAALRRYLLYWEQHIAEDHGQAHSGAQLEAVRHDVGRLLYRLEDGRAPFGTRVQHSPEAVLPDRPASESIGEAVGTPVGADSTAVDWQRLNLDGAFALAAEADDGRDNPGVLGLARDGDASFVLVAVPGNREWAVTHLFFASGEERRHMSLTSMVSTLEPEVTAVGCAYEHSDRGPRYHYAVIRRPSADANVRARLDDGAWKTTTRGRDGWFVTISTGQGPDSALHLEELVQGSWHRLH